MTDQLPEHFHRIERSEAFTFSCHPGISCFTECCRELDLALTPYDVVRLKNRLDMHSGRFLEQYVIIEWDESTIFPQCYLTMVDDGRASCVFVSTAGCTVYEDRPSSCRAYPVGRGATRRGDGQVDEQFILVKEPHCKGFAEPAAQTADTYFINQGLAEYNRFNDVLMTILQHEKIMNGYRLSRQQVEQFLLALYNLDMFRQEMSDGRIAMKKPLTPEDLQGLAGDDEKLLLLSVKWLKQELFDE